MNPKNPPALGGDGAEEEEAGINEAKGLEEEEEPDEEVG